MTSFYCYLLFKWWFQDGWHVQRMKTHLRTRRLNFGFYCMPRYPLENTGNQGSRIDHTETHVILTTKHRTKTNKSKTQQRNINRWETRTDQNSGSACMVYCYIDFGYIKVLDLTVVVLRSVMSIKCEHSEHKNDFASFKTFENY